MRKVGVVFVIAVAVLSGSASAQICAGGLGLQSSSAQLGAGATVGNNSTLFSGGATLGRPNSVFGSLGVGYAVLDGEGLFDEDPSGWTLGGGLGYAASLGSEGRAEFCPMAGVSFLRVSGDIFDESITLNQTSFQFGGFFGYMLPSAGRVTITPFVGLSYVRSDGTLKGGGESLDLDADSFTPGTIGVGIAPSPQFAFVGSVMVPFGLEGADPSFTLGMRFGVGRR